MSVPIRRVLGILFAAATFGALVALAKGQGFGLRDQLGNLSAPWLLVGLLAGAPPGWRAQAFPRRLLGGAVLGLAATLVALVGFYAVVALAGDHGRQTGVLTVLTMVMRSNIRYVAGGLFSGPMFGAVGAWCGRRPRHLALVTGLLLVLEPFVVAVVGMLVPIGPPSGAWYLPYAGELVVGAATLLAVTLGRAGLARNQEV